MATAGRTAAERTMGLIVWALAFDIFGTSPASPGPAARSEQPGECRDEATQETSPDDAGTHLGGSS